MRALVRGKAVRGMIAAAALAIAVSAGCALPAAAQSDNAYDVLLIGVDRRDESWFGNSDVMMLVTINDSKEKIFVTSFLRDLGVDIPGIGLHKLNAACANGGPELTVETIEQNFDLKIDNYAMVDFNSMRDIVDAVGGVDIEMDEDEVVVANDYIKTMCEANDDRFEDHEIKGSGLLHLDGYQAVGYCRNRFTGSENDFGRTERQRKVIHAIVDGIRDESVFGAVLTALKILPSIESDLGAGDTVNLLSKAPAIISYGMEELHIPYDDLYTIQDEMLMYDHDETISRLHATIFG